MAVIVRRLVAAAAAAVVVAAAAGCGGSSGAGGGSSSSSGGAAPSAGTDVHLADAANGTTVDVSRGRNVVVVLHSTYWTLAPVAGSLRLAGAPVVAPGHCTAPGSGCGTVTATYVATSPGTSQLHAHRDSCGEALRCTGNAGNWTVTVEVH